MQTQLEKHSSDWGHIVKIGRTHLMDATPLTVGQEWSAYAEQMRKGIERLDSALAGVYELALGILRVYVCSVS